MAKRKLFVVGVGRSGTSLVQSMISANPQVAFMPETAFLRRMVFRGYLQAILKKYGVEAATRALDSDKYFSRTGLDAWTMVARARDRGGLLDVAVYREMLRSYVEKGLTWVGEKDPKALEFLPLMAAVMPNVHVVHVFRDPRDVLASKKKAAWSQNSHIWKHVFANRVQFRMGLEWGPALFGKRYHEICYEELLARPVEVLSQCCEEIGVEYDDLMLSFGDAARKLVAAEEMSWKRETLGPLLTGNRDKWRNELEAKEVILTELCCNEVMVKGGYVKDSRTRRFSLKDTAWIWTGWLLIVLATWPYLQIRLFLNRRACGRIK